MFKWGGLGLSIIVDWERVYGTLLNHWLLMDSGEVAVCPLRSH